MPDALSEILAQADQIGKNRMRLPAPPNTGNTLKDFLLNALGTAPMALGAKTAPGVRVTGGVFDGSTPGNPSKIHAPNSAMDLNLKMGGSSPPFNRVEGIPEVGTPANANINNPKALDVLKALSDRDVPFKIKDAKGGTSYIYAKNPHDNSKIEIRAPSDEHAAGFKATELKIPGDFFDLGTKKTKAGGGYGPFTKNASGERYGTTPGAIQDAIDHRLSTGLVPEGREPNYVRPRMESESKSQPDPNQLTLDLHSKIDEVLGKLDGSKLPGIDYQPGRKQTFGTEPTRSVGLPANQNYNKQMIEHFKGDPVKTPLSITEAHDLSYHKGDVGPLTEHVQRNMNVLHQDEFPNMQTSSKLGEFTKDPSELVAANTGQKPKLPDLLTDLMLKSESGKYSLAHMKQKLDKMGIDHTNMQFLDMFKALNPELFPK